MNENDEERRAIIHEFYQIYRSLQERHDLRLHTCFSLHDEGVLEIWEYENDRKIKQVCMIKGDSEERSYKRAMEILNYMRQREEDALGEGERKAG